MSISSNKFSAPMADEYNEYYEQYISKFRGEDFLAEFEGQVALLNELFGNLKPGQDSELHAPYTWTLKQLMGHLIDCERIFSTRLLRIAANDQNPIPGIDQNIYVDNLDYETVTMAELLEEFGCLRKANALLAKRLPAESLDLRGVASGNPVSARANLFILGGHVVYHAEIARQRLGADA